MRISVLVLSVLGLLGCAKPDSYYITTGELPIVQELRVLFSEEFEYACTGEGSHDDKRVHYGDWKEYELEPLGGYGEPTGEWVCDDPGSLQGQPLADSSCNKLRYLSFRSPRRGAMLDRVLVKRDELRSRMHPLVEWDDLPRDLKCYMAWQWGCRDTIYSSNYGISCAKEIILDP